MDLTIRSRHELRDALAQPGCPVCRLANKAVESYIGNLLYESTNDIVIRARLRKARGFCRTHAGRLNRPGASLSIAIIQHDVLGALLATLEDNAQTHEPRRAASLARDLGPQETCPACWQQGEMEHLYLEALFKGIADADIWQAYTASAGLCLPHFRQALRQARNAEALAQLIRAQRCIWERLRAELAEFIRKNDYRFRDEGFGAEGDSWLRATEAVVGQEGST
ncbi:MAG: hypothetical protein IT330_12300 [Anaerolineae bacterium]|nr:hypothetical protein [Anaerolineae bacterium]